ncbi:hypothetical protein [Streptomyces sp. NPDC051162]
MPEITGGRYVTCVKETGHRGGAMAAQYRSPIAELGGFARARCRPDAD